MQSLDVISVNLWQMVASLANLVLLFLIVKRFLYKPVKKMLAAREETIQNDYAAAKDAKNQAIAEREEYEKKLLDAKQRADEIVKSAVSTAALREKEVIANASEKAERIIKRAEQEAALERKKAEDVMKREIVEVSAMLTEKLLDREVAEDDHRQFIDSFIESIGDEDGSN